MEYKECKIENFAFSLQSSWILKQRKKIQMPVKPLSPFLEQQKKFRLSCYFVFFQPFKCLTPPQVSVKEKHYHIRSWLHFSKNKSLPYYKRQITHIVNITPVIYSIISIISWHYHFTDKFSLIHTLIPKQYLTLTDKHHFNIYFVNSFYSFYPFYSLNSSNSKVPFSPFNNCQSIYRISQFLLIPGC